MAGKSIRESAAFSAVITMSVVAYFMVVRQGFHVWYISADKYVSVRRALNTHTFHHHHIIPVSSYSWHVALPELTICLFCFPAWWCLEYWTGFIWNQRNNLVVEGEGNLAHLTVLHESNIPNSGGINEFF